MKGILNWESGKLGFVEIGLRGLSRECIVQICFDDLVFGLFFGLNFLFWLVVFLNLGFKCFIGLIYFQIFKVFVLCMFLLYMVF